jgi:malate dehydrogenase (oxaloacetate-decarboxylating)(NADP+)
VKNVKPTILLGTSGTPGTFSKEVVEEMARINERPIIFPLSNPTSKSECTAEEAITWSQGRAIVATGSPFAPVTFNGVRHRIGQGNNAFIFPGVGLGISAGRVSRVSDKMFLEAARALAAKVSPEDLRESAVYPQLSRIRECSLSVACATVQQAVKEGHADEEILEGLEDNLRAAMWEPKYLPIRFEQ